MVDAYFDVDIGCDARGSPPYSERIKDIFQILATNEPDMVCASGYVYIKGTVGDKPAFSKMYGNTSGQENVTTVQELSDELGKYDTIDKVVSVRPDNETNGHIYLVDPEAHGVYATNRRIDIYTKSFLGFGLGQINVSMSVSPDGTDNADAILDELENLN